MKNKKIYYLSYLVVLFAGLFLFPAIFFDCSGKSEEDLEELFPESFKILKKLFPNAF